MITDQLNGVHFKVVKTEGLDEYMQTMNVGFILRKVARALTFSERLTKDGDTITIDTFSTFKNDKMVFKLDTEFLHEDIDGKEMRITYSVVGDALVAEAVPVKEGNGYPYRMERRLLPDGNLEMKLISRPSNVACTRILARTGK